MQMFQAMDAFYWIIGILSFASICLLVYLMVNAFKDEAPDEPEQPKKQPFGGGETIKYPSTHTIKMEAPKRNAPNPVKYKKNVKINGSGGSTIIVEDDGGYIDDDGVADIIDATTYLALTTLDVATTQPDNSYIPDSSPVNTYVPDSSPSYSPDPSPSVQDNWSSSPSFDSSSSHSSYDSGSSSSYDSGSSSSYDSGSSSSYDSSSSSSSFDSGSSW